MQLSALKLSTLVFFTAMGWTVELLAQTPSTEEPAGTIARLSLAVTPTVGTALGPRTSISMSDMIRASNLSVMAGFRLAPQWRLSPYWGAGLALGVFWLDGIAGTKTRWHDAQLSLRYYPGVRTMSGPWLEASGGLAVARDSHYLPYLSRDKVVHTWGPAASLASGWNVELVRHFGIAPEIRLMWFGLHAQPSTSVDYGSQFIAQIGFSVIGFGLYRAPTASQAVSE